MNNISTLFLRVTPTFDETPWAWLTYLFLFGLFIGSVIYILFYIYRLRHQMDVQKELSNIKLRFFTDISHELRTPLTLISSPVSEVLEDDTLSPSVREHLNIVHKNTERMLRLVNQILDFRKIQNNKMKLLLEETELIVFLMKITENFRLTAEEKQIDFTFHADQEELYLWIDRDKVEKIIFNLLSNAFKYTLPGKSVQVSVQSQEKYIRISVIDEGIGIEEGKVDSLFKRFETLTKTNILQPSSGIGLSLVKELVELHHGEIEVESQRGAGSKFSVTLPVGREIFEQDEQAELILNDSTENEPPLSYPVAEPTGEPGTEATEQLSVLIVEDNQELRHLLKNYSFQEIYHSGSCQWRRRIETGPAGHSRYDHQ